MKERALACGLPPAKPSRQGWQVAGPAPAGGCYAEHKIGTSDDLQDADGVAILDYGQAQKVARAWWRAELRPAASAAARTSYGPPAGSLALGLFKTRCRSVRCEFGWNMGKIRQIPKNPIISMIYFRG